MNSFKPSMESLEPRWTPDGPRPLGLADHTVMCVGALLGAVEKDAEAAAVAWRICVKMFDGSAILDRVFRGLFVAERHIRRNGLGTLLDGRFKTAVERLDPKTITKSIFQAAEYWGKSGPNVEGEAVVVLTADQVAPPQ